MDKRLRDFLGARPQAIDEGRNLFVGPLTGEGIDYLELEMGKTYTEILQDWSAKVDENFQMKMPFKEMRRIIAAICLQYDSEEERDKYEVNEKALRRRLNNVKRELSKIMIAGKMIEYANMINAAFTLPVNDTDEDDGSDFPKDQKTEDQASSNGPDVTTQSQKNTDGQSEK